jgi:ubiquitin-protein ligase
MNPRLRRLTADYERVVAAFNAHPHIRLIQTEGNPPEKYTFEFHLDGLVPEAGGTCSLAPAHRAEIFLPLDYPRRPPFCRMTTPVFHPNIDPQKICIGDHWSAGQSLAQMVVHIAEMIAYQRYNVKSPLNAEAAAWAETNTDKFPLHKADLSGGL